jgi:excisionase family DNA binding protein
MILTAREAAEYLRVPLRTFYYLVQQGRIARYTISPRVTRYEQDDLDAFLKSCRTISISKSNVTVLRSTERLTDASTELADYFQKAGIKLKPGPAKGPKRFST